MLTIGVVIPTFERPLQTLSAVESALAQSRVPDSIVVVDDGSSDECRLLLARGLETLPVELILRPHCGHPGRVRNVGCKALTTTHVAFLDSDDLWIREKLEIQEELALSGVRAQGSGYVVAGAPRSGNETINRASTSLSLRQLLIANELCNSSVLVERSLLEEIGGLPISYAVRGIEDYAAWLRIATISEFVLVGEPLVIYSDEPEGSMRGTNYFSVPENILALWDFAAWLEGQGRVVPPVVRLSLRVSNRMLLQWAARQRLT